MKRIILLGLVVFLCLPVVVYAASMGGVETQGQGKFAIGMDQEFVFDKDYKDVTLGDASAYDYTGTILINGEPTDLHIIGAVGESKSKLELNNMSRSMIKLSYGVLDNLDIFVRLGEANFKEKIKGEASDSGTFDDPISGNSGTYTGIVENTGTFTGKSALAWGLGAKGVYPFENGWFLGIQAQYLTHRNSLKNKMAEKESGTAVVTAGPDTGTTATFESAGEEYQWNAKATVQEWQIAPYVAKKLGNFIPYLGVKYSDQRINYKDEDMKMKMKATDNFGVFLGTDYKIGKNFSLNIEGRFIDETAMSVGATYRF